MYLANKPRSKQYEKKMVVVVARKSKYTPATVKRVLDAIQMGATYELAANSAGISYELMRQWMRDNVVFLEAVKEAEGKAALVWLIHIERAANDGNWQAAAWKLERRYPEMYGQPKVRHEVTGPNGGSIPVEFVARTAIAEVAAGSIEDRRSAE